MAILAYLGCAFARMVLAVRRASEHREERAHVATVQLLQRRHTELVQTASIAMQSWMCAPSTNPSMASYASMSDDGVRRSSGRQTSGRMRRRRRRRWIRAWLRFTAPNPRTPRRTTFHTPERPRWSSEIRTKRRRRRPTKRERRRRRSTSYSPKTSSSFPASLHQRPRLDHRRQTSQPFCIRRLSERPFVFPRVFHLRRNASDERRRRRRPVGFTMG